MRAGLVHRRPEAPEDSETDEEPLTASLSGVKFPRRRIGERMTSVVGARQVSLPTALLQPTGTGWTAYPFA